jgi:hypothetical protein
LQLAQRGKDVMGMRLRRFQHFPETMPVVFGDTVKWGWEMGMENQK